MSETELREIKREREQKQEFSSCDDNNKEQGIKFSGWGEIERENVEEQRKEEDQFQRTERTRKNERERGDEDQDM